MDKYNAPKRCEVPGCLYNAVFCISVQTIGDEGGYTALEVCKGHIQDFLNMAKFMLAAMR